MIRVPTQYETMRLNVFLKNGDRFLGKDTTNLPLGDNECTVCFWEEDILMIFPMEQVERLEMLF